MEDFLSLPSLGTDELNNIDQYPQVTWPPGILEYSEDEKRIITKCVNHLKSNSTLNSIVEIGVDRDKNNPNTQTKTFIGNKNPSTKYFGFDIEPRYHVAQYGENCFFYLNDGGDVATNIDVLKNNNVQSVDLLFIDGWHSVNQVIKEWDWAKYLSPDGLILIHDTNYHPGPKEVISKLNPAKWSYKKFCVPPKMCWGVAAIWRADSKINDILCNWD